MSLVSYKGKLKYRPINERRLYRIQSLTVCILYTRTINSRMRFIYAFKKKKTNSLDLKKAGIKYTRDRSMST